MAEDSVDSRSPEELARLYAPAAYAEAATAPGADDATKGGQAESRPALEESRDRGAATAPADRNAIASGFTARRGRTGPPLPEGGKLRTTRWQARDELPLGSVSLWSVGGSRKGKLAAALVLFALIGGAGAVVTLESLSSTAPDNTMAAVDRTIGGEGSDSSAKTRPTRALASAGRAADRNIEIVHANDVGNGLAPGDGSPLPRSAKVIPLPLPVATASDPGLRRTRDAGGGDDPAVNRGGSRTASASPSGGVGSASVGGHSGDGAAADGGTAAIDDGGGSAAPMPGLPIPRPNHDGGPADGVLAYAPAAEMIDHGAKVLAKKGAAKAAKAGSDLSAGTARVTAWVNMRASADNNAATVKVLQSGSIVTVVQCKFWCEIVSDGKHGYIYKRFLAASGESASAQ